MNEQQWRDRYKANRAAINQVECPRCGVPAHKPCVQPAGHAPGWPHAARRRLAAERGLYQPA